MTGGDFLLLNMLAVDLGASSGRVMQAVFNGNALSLQEVRRFQNQPLRISNRRYWNVYSLFQEIKSGISDAAQTDGNIASLGIDSWAVDFGLLDVQGHLLDLPRHYRDQRNLAAFQEVVRRVGKDALFERTGIQLNPINTLYQLYAMKQENANLLDASNKLLMIPDLLNFFLSGKQAAEFTNATTTQLLAPNGEWDTELLAMLDLPTSVLPRITKPATVLGSIRDEELISLKSVMQTKVVHVASHDTAAAVLSVPYEKPNYVYISSGTWSLVGTVIEKPLINEWTRQFNLTNEGGVGNYRLLKNVMGLWLVQETQRALRAMGEPDDIERLVHQAKLAKPFPFVFNPDDTRLLQPDHMPEAIRQICLETDQSVPQDSGELVRGVFESLALKYRQVLDELELVTGQHYTTIHVVGGGAQNQLLSQFTADATGRTVVTGPLEASAMGNVASQLLALGELSSVSEVAKLIRHSVEPVLYLPRECEPWNDAYTSFLVVSRKQAETSMSL